MQARGLIADDFSAAEQEKIPAVAKKTLENETAE
jgi:hypothetical protein